MQVLYWLGLSTWFGGALFIGVAAQVIFNTVKENDPTLPRVLSVNLQSQHATLLAGSIVGNLIAMLARIELACAALLFVTIAAQWFLIDLANPLSRVSAFVRSALYLASTGIVVYDWRVLWPRIRDSRQKFIDNADNPEIANPTLEILDRDQRESMSLLNVLVFLLLGIVLFSAAMTPPTITYFSAQ
ncbi:MAG: hypothetical protein M3O30_07860 [Planctomycetota bacterium]|nr:hypothetical protein [Planctomycetota bacterium]